MILRKIPENLRRGALAVGFAAPLVILGWGLLRVADNLIDAAFRSIDLGYTDSSLTLSGLSRAISPIGIGLTIAGAVFLVIAVVLLFADRHKGSSNVADRARVSLDQALEALANLDSEFADRDEQLADTRQELENVRQAVDSTLTRISGAGGPKKWDRASIVTIAGIVVGIIGIAVSLMNS